MSESSTCTGGMVLPKVGVPPTIFFLAQAQGSILTTPLYKFLDPPLGIIISIKTENFYLGNE